MEITKRGHIFDVHQHAQMAGKTGQTGGAPVLQPGHEQQPHRGDGAFTRARIEHNGADSGVIQHLAAARETLALAHQADDTVRRIENDREHASPQSPPSKEGRFYREVRIMWTKCNVCLGNNL